MKLTKPEAMKIITSQWLALSEKDRNTLYFMQYFYPQLAKSQPELLTWRLAGGHRDTEVMAQLMKKNLVSVPK